MRIIPWYAEMKIKINPFTFDIGNMYGSSKDPIIVYEGENVRLRCASSGAPKPHVEWRRTDGQLIFTGTYQGV